MQNSIYLNSFPSIIFFNEVSNVSNERSVALLDEGCYWVIVKCFIPFNLQEVLNSWLESEGPLSVTIKFGIPWIENKIWYSISNGRLLQTKFGKLLELNQSILSRNRKWLKTFFPRRNYQNQYEFSFMRLSLFSYQCIGARLQIHFVLYSGLGRCGRRE